MKYEILGEPLPVVVCHLEGGESMITERGSMVWMSPNMKMETGAGGIGKAFGRMFSGDSIFQNTYTAQGGPGMIAFGSSFPGSIRAIEVDPAHPVVVQKRGFLASEQSVVVESSMEITIRLTQMQAWHLTMLLYCGLELVLCAVFYIITVMNLKKRLNLA